MYERNERPCGDCLWNGAEGCTTWDCQPVTLEEARKIVRKAASVRKIITTTAPTAGLI